VFLVGVVVLFLSPSKRLSQRVDQDVAVLSSSESSATPGYTAQAEPIVAPVVEDKTSPLGEVAGPQPLPSQEQQDTPPKEDISPPAEKPEKPVEAKPQEPAPGLRVVVKRRVERTEEDLVKQIAEATTVALDRTAKRVDSNAAIAAGLKAHTSGITNHDTTLAMIDQRADLAGLPLRRGTACRLPRAAAAHFDDSAKILRGKVSRPDELRMTLADESKQNKWLKKETVPVLMQMLTPEVAPVREVLVEHLSRIPHKEATAALTQLALFDLHPQVRARAINALSDRPVKEYRGALLKGFEYPWPAVADHAAEALVALKMKDTVPNLAMLLDKPDPRAPYGKPNTNQRFVKEMVRVNHLRNCLLCHAPSFQAQDKVRGVVPPTNQPLSPAYYAPATGIFVRADVTYLKQDFSRMLAVAKPGKWPAVQRFDFFVRERFATERDQRERIARRKAGPYEQQEALVFALRELTGRDPGPTVADWKAFVFAYPLRD
jgi:HEAT repeat protein